MAVLSSKLILELVDRVTAPARRVNETVKNLNGRIEANNRRIAEVRGQAFSAAAGVAAFAAAMWKPVTAAADFEAAMNRVQAALTASDDETEALAAKARELGQSTQFSATEAADAIEMLAKNGLSASQILGGALEQSLKLAAASGTDLASAADLATDIMLNFGMGADELGTAVDGVTGVLLASKFGFDDYRLALAQAGGVAGGLGVKLDEFNAVIAATSSAFASGSDAGTSFKTFLQRLVPASNPATEAMNRLGLEFFDAQGNMKSMADIAQELQDGFAGLSEEARNDALSTIFGTDAMRTAIGLMREGEQGVHRLEKAIAEASAADQAAARMKGFWGMVENVKSAAEGLAISIGDTLLPELTDLGMRVTPIIAAIAVWTAAHPQLVSNIIAATAALLGFRLALAGLRLAGLMSMGAYLKSVAFGFGIIGAQTSRIGRAARESMRLNAALAGMQGLQPGRLSQIGAALRGIASATGLSTAAAGISAVVGAVAAISAPVWVGIAAAIAAVGLAWKYWDRIEAIASGVGRAISDELGDALEKLRPILEPIQPVLNGIVSGLNSLSDAMHAVVGVIGEFFSSFGEQEVLTADQEAAAEQRAYEIARKVIAGLTSLRPALVDLGISAIQGLWDGMSERLAGLLDWIRGIPARIRDAMPKISLPFGLGGGDAEPEQPRAAGGWVSPGGVRVGEHGEERLYASQAGFIAHHRAVRQMAAMASRVSIPQPRALALAPSGRAGGGPVNVTFGDIVIQGGAGASAAELRSAFGREAAAALRSHFGDTF